MPIPRDTKAKFIAKSQRRWGDRFSYNQVHYTNSRTPVLIWCKTHKAYFSQTPKAHFAAKHACCPKCYAEIAGTFQNAWRKNDRDVDISRHNQFRSLLNQALS
ncbi:hypothetical protein HRJ45_24445 [Vibrio coralliilyticus]|uniref:hypothetical protein n=1 Tax=Vibrio coralliilyticus TaxID=190893 RepID=UPI00155FF594|nr:hypothetical protein [Vibrio coralliilyticus]NRF28136.1 hypothetical protein [Vibrio coralliilyticus]NRF82260.1 hypothetical protein [Vibrio coralliilyticus]